MMKKFLALVLCLALLGCAAAFAENDATNYSGEVTVPNRFTIRWIAPEDYELKIVDTGDPNIGNAG